MGKTFIWQKNDTEMMEMVNRTDSFDCMKISVEGDDGVLVDLNSNTIDRNEREKNEIRLVNLNELILRTDAIGTTRAEKTIIQIAFKVEMLYPEGVPK